MSDADRNLHIYYVNPLRHVDGMLMAYLPKERMLIQADLLDTNRPMPEALSRDQQSFFRAVQKLKLDETGYAFPMQLWPRVAQHGLRLTEIPVRLIYNDPTRHFGGQLDDASYRMKHYLDVLRAELDCPAPACPSRPSMRVRVFKCGAAARRPPREYSITLERFTKSSGESGEANRAVPAVGSTWLGPAT